MDITGLFTLEGRRALITGASKGLGKGIASAFAAAGADVILVARDTQGLQEAAAEVERHGRTAITAIAELEHYDEVISVATNALQQWPTIDILVNCAGVSFPEPAVETTEEHWERTFAVNSKAAFFLAKMLAPPMMKQRYGRIINITSQSGLVALENHLAYCGSKFALEGVSKVLALEWAPYGITVNCIAPTVVDTPMARMAFNTEEKRQSMLRRIPLGRFGTIDEVAHAALYLASPGASLITGDTLRLDGGWTAQ